MKRYTLPLGRVAEHVHPAPERTASRSLPGAFGDIEFQVWPSRAAMLKSCDMQEAAGTPRPWRPLVKRNV